MTVEELRQKLEGIDPRTEVVAQWRVDNEPTYFDVAAASLAVHRCGGSLTALRAPRVPLLPSMLFLLHGFVFYVSP